MFENMNLETEPKYPKSIKYRNNIRFELPYFLHTTPNEIIEKVTNKVKSFCSFKSETKIYIMKDTVPCAQLQNVAPAIYK